MVVGLSLGDSFSAFFSSSSSSFPNTSRSSLGSSSNSSNSKPRPLKQRTSSIDARRDYTHQTWLSLLDLLQLREFIVTVDHFRIWRRHVSWAMPVGDKLKDYLTQRYASSMVFLSLLLSTELNVLFNSAAVTTSVRDGLWEEEYWSIRFWTGIALMMSAVLTLFSLITTFTMWTMVSAVNPVNAPCLFRSSIGQYVFELPGRLIVGAIYSFLLWWILFIFLLIPFGPSSFALLLLILGMFLYTITSLSAFGRLILHTGAMGSKPIFEPTYEASLAPNSLHNGLLLKAKANLQNNLSIRRQYHSKHSRPLDQAFGSLDEMADYLNSCEYGSGALSSQPTPRSSNTSDELPSPTRKRTASLVRFADGMDTSGEKFDQEYHLAAMKRKSSMDDGQRQDSFSGMDRIDESSMSQAGGGSSSRGTSASPVPSTGGSSIESTPAIAAAWVRTTSNDSFTSSSWLEEWTKRSSAGGLQQQQSPQRTAAPRPSNLIQARASPSLPRHVTSHRVTSSIVSSLAEGEDLEAPVVEDDLTADERFDREYGDLFDGEPTPPPPLQLLQQRGPTRRYSPSSVQPVVPSKAGGSSGSSGNDNDKSSTWNGMTTSELLGTQEERTSLLFDRMQDGSSEEQQQQQLYYDDSMRDRQRENTGKLKQQEEPQPK